MSSNYKLFDDDTSLASVINDIRSRGATLRHDLSEISNWAFQWKIAFNPDLTEQEQEVILSRKLRN